MAQQDMSQTAEQSDAAAAAAAIAADIDAMSAERFADLPDAGAEELPVSAEAPDAPSGPEATTYLLIKELRSISRARSLRLQPEDLIVAVDGQHLRMGSEGHGDLVPELAEPNHTDVFLSFAHPIITLPSG